jgi:hypothetical protein
MGSKFPVARDVFERVVMTFLAAVAASIVSDAANWTDVLSLSNWKAWGFAGLAAAFTLVKSLLATQVGKMNGKAASASLDPEVKLQPVDASPSRL